MTVSPSDLHRLNAADLRNVLVAVEEMHGLDPRQGFVPLAHHLLGQLVRLVPRADLANLGHIDYRTREGTFVTPWGFVMPPDRRARTAEFLHEHPVLMHHQRTGDGAPQQIIDFSSRRQFEQTGLYHECYRGYVRGMILFAVPSPPMTTINISLSSTRVDFTERDRAVLSVVRPHVERVLARCMEDVARQARFGGSEKGGGAEPAVVQTEAGGNVYYRTRAAADVLDRHFPGASAHRLPEPVHQWLRGLETPCADGAAIRGRIFVGPNSRAPIEIDARWSGGTWALTLRDPRPATEPPSRPDLGLSRRETEVLAWMTRCKTNAEIGVILELSPRTVEKHVEAILRKLKVEHRTAAIMRALGCDDDGPPSRAG